MFALIAAIVFLLELLGLRLGSIDLTLLGLLFAALQLAFGTGVPIRRS
jgi:hypothetical protein